MPPRPPASARTVRFLPLLVFALGLVPLVGCAPGNPGLTILNVIAPDETCMIDVGNAQIAFGVYDVDGVTIRGVPPAGGGPGPVLAMGMSPYTVALRYGSQLINLGQTGTGGPPMADPNALIVQLIDVELRDIGGAPLALGVDNPYRVPAGAGFVPSSDGMTLGEGHGLAAIISTDYAAALDDAFLGGLAATGGRATIVVSITAIGRTVGNSEVVSNEFNFPIELCDGDCLNTCSVDDMGQAICRASCTPGQDTFHISCEPGCVAN